MNNTLTAAVLLIGNELLSGRVQDLNLSHLSITLELRGIRVREARIVPDIEEEIIDALNHMRQKFDYVFTTGGIGPTHDDITSDSIAKAFNLNNVIQPKPMAALERYFNTKGVQFTEAAARMAYAPEGAELFCNTDGIAQAYRINNVFVLPGVPSIMRNMLELVVDQLKAGRTILTGTVQTNASESEIAKPLALIQERHNTVDIGSYPQDKNSEFSDYRVIFMVKGTDLEEIQITCDKILAACKDRGHDAILA